MCLLFSCEQGVEQFLDDPELKLLLLQPTLPAAPSVSLGAPSQRYLPAAPRGDSYLQQSSVMRLLLLEQRMQPKLLEILLDRFTDMESAKNKGDERCVDVDEQWLPPHTRQSSGIVLVAC